MFPSVIFLFSLLALVQAIPGPGLQRSGSLCSISLLDLPWTSFQDESASWVPRCVHNFLEENGYTIQFKENSAACQLKIFRPKKAAPDHPIVVQAMTVEESTLFNIGSLDFDLKNKKDYPCKYDYAVKLVCELKSGSDVLVAQSNQFEICLPGTS